MAATQVNVSLSAETLAMIDRVAKANGLSRSAVVEVMVRRYIVAQEAGSGSGASGLIVLEVPDPERMGSKGDSH